MTDDIMNVQNNIITAASNGKIDELKRILSGKSKEETRTILQSQHNGSTTLTVACKQGHLSIVKYVVEKYGVDPEQTASVIIDGEVIDDAPPLWCAAAAGHTNIVKYLTSIGCNVNKTTRSNSTPLRAACFDGYYDIVVHLLRLNADVEIANRHGHTCLMIACYRGHTKIVNLLLDHSVDINRKSNKGNTALHDCAEAGNLLIMKCLLNRKAVMAQDSLGISPIFAAALSGHSNIVEYIILSNLCSVSEAIDALELLGATSIDKRRDFTLAVKYWQRAMNMRKTYDIPKTIGGTKSKAAYNFVVEATDADSLEELQSYPDFLRMQSLLIRERILTPAHPDTSYYVRYRGALYADMGNFSRCLSLWMYALDMQQSHQLALNPMTLSSFLSFAELFSFMTSSQFRSNNPSVSIDFSFFLEVLNKVMLELDRAKNVDLSSEEFLGDLCNEVKHHRLLIIIMHLLSLGCQSVASASDDKTELSIFTHYNLEEDVKCFHRCVYTWLKKGYRGNLGVSPLHLACCRDTSNVGKYPVCIFPSSDVVRLLVKLGADVNECDNTRTTPLQYAAANRPVDFDILFVLLEMGAHLDCRNSIKETALDILGATESIKINSLNYINLQCLAAQAVRNYNISYSDIVQKKLKEFIDYH